jgi:hypothetical protein
MNSNFQPFRYSAQRFYPWQPEKKPEHSSDCVILENNLFHLVQTSSVSGQDETVIVEGMPELLPKRDKVIITIATSYEDTFSNSEEVTFAVFFGPESRFNIQRPVLRSDNSHSHLHAAIDALIAAGILREAYLVDGQKLCAVILRTDEPALVRMAVNDLPSRRCQKVLKEKTQYPDLWERLGAEIGRLNSKGVEVHF